GHGDAARMTTAAALSWVWSSFVPLGPVAGAEHLDGISGDVAVVIRQRGQPVDRPPAGIGGVVGRLRPRTSADRSGRGRDDAPVRDGDESARVPTRRGIAADRAKFVAGDVGFLSEFSAGRG